MIHRIMQATWDYASSKDWFLVRPWTPSGRDFSVFSMLPLIYVIVYFYSRRMYSQEEKE